MTLPLDTSFTTPAATMPEAGSVEPWRLRFWSIFGGQAMSLMGSSLTQFVLLW